MNERIKELEVQCWEPRKYGPAWFDAEKFARLLVKECALVLEQQAAFSKNDRHAYYYGASLLEEHFGFEE